MRKPAAVGLAACFTLGLSGAGLAQDLKATERFGASVVTFELQGAYSNVTLTVSGPNRFHMSASTKDGAPSIDLRRGGEFDDGQYNYQLTAAVEERAIVRTRLDDGRESAAGNADPLKSVAASGIFRVQNGAIVARDLSARERQQKRK